MFDPTVFKMKDGVLMFTKAANKNNVGEVGRICIPGSMVREVWSLCHQSDMGGHRGLEGTLNKFLRGFFMVSPRQKLRFLNGGCDTCTYSQETEHASKDQNTRSILDGIRWRKAIRRLSVYVRYSERKLILAHGRGQF